MRYLLRRTAFYLIALWAAVTFNFVIPRLMPGDPAEAYIAKLQTQQITRAQIAAIRTEFGVNPDVPIWKQYFDYLNGLLHGQPGHLDLAISLRRSSDILRQSLPWTIGLVGTARHSELSHRHPGRHVDRLEARLLVRYGCASNSDVSLRRSLFLDGAGVDLHIWRELELVPHR